MTRQGFDVLCRIPAAVVASPSLEFRQRLVKRLRARRWNTQEARGGAEALSMVENGVFRVLVLDRWLPDLEVPELVEIVTTRHPQVKVLVPDSEAEEQNFVQRLSLGDVIECGFPEMQGSIPSTIGGTQVLELPVRTEGRTRAVEWAEPLPEMIGTSAAMQRAYRLARLVLPRDTTVLITGETGTGKELMARAIHNLSPRGRQPFVIVNCAAIPEALLESEMFGYCRGAFTGAIQSRLGRIHAAHGGTLFLDEVGGLPLNMQAKLLRFLQEGEVQRLGSADTLRVDVRVLAATNLDLAQARSKREFDDALFYRLCAFPIWLPPLRERTGDVLPLAKQFLQSFCGDAGAPAKYLTTQAERALEAHSWPGNVRELKHVVERAFILSEEEEAIQPEHIVLAA